MYDYVGINFNNEGTDDEEIETRIKQARQITKYFDGKTLFEQILFEHFQMFNFYLEVTWIPKDEVCQSQNFC